MAFFLRRRSAAAAAAPNRIVIGGAGTGVPLLEPCHPLLDPDDEPLVDELPLVELLPEVDDEPEVLVVMFPELDPLVDQPLVLLEEPWLLEP